MAVVSRIGKLRFDDGLGTFRQWQATADVQDAAAGATFTITVEQTSAGTSPPGVANTLTLNVYRDDGVLQQAFTLTAASASQVVTFTPATVGTFSIDIRATRTSVPTYDYETDGSPATPPTGFTATSDRGWVRTTTTATVALSRVDEYAYGDAMTATVTLGAAPSVSRNTVLTLGPVSATTLSGTTTSHTPNLGTCDNRFPASATAYTTALSFANATLTGQPWTTATVTEDSVTVDPRLTSTPLLQNNDNVFGTPPTSKAALNNRRLASDLGFISVRYTNARGEGLNDLTYDGKLWDEGELVGSEASPVKTATGRVTKTQGGEVGWGPSFTPWDSQLPSGNWITKTTVTAPAGATNLDPAPSSIYSLIAADPNLKCIVGAGPTDDRKHFVPGGPFLVVLGGFNTTTAKRIAVDAGTAMVAVSRINLATERIQYLEADGVTWTDITDAATVYFHSMTALTGDAKVFKKVFTNTAGWGSSDLVVIGKAAVGGVPITADAKEISVQSINNHDSYKFDGAGFVGFPTR